MRTLAAALMLLTRLPMPASAGSVAPGRAAALYPVAGALVGAAVAGALAGSGELWPPLVAAVLAVGVEVVLTGALHLDGLADCADGLAGREREQRLRIMKDSSVGVYAAATIGLALLLKVALLAWLLAILDGRDVLVLLVGSYAASRAALLPLARFLSYARADGTGRGVVEGLGNNATVIGVLLGVSAVAAIGVLDPVAAVVVLLAMAAAAAAVGLLAHRRLGGVTGDVLGACVEVSLLAGLLGAAAVL